MSVRRRIVAATGGMAVVTAISRVTGYARDKTVAALIGAGPVADAFYAAFAIPNMFRAFLAEGALHASFIPALTELRGRADPERQREFVRAMTSALLLTLPLVIAGGILIAPFLLRLFAPGIAADAEQFRLAVRLTRLMFPYLGLITLAGLAQAVLNASGRFLLPTATPMALNLMEVVGTLIAVTVASGRWDWLAYGVLAGGALQFLLQWPATARLGLPLLPGRSAFNHPEVRRVLALMVPGIPALGVYQLTLLASYRFASSVGEGGITARFNAARLSELVYGVIIVQLTTAVLPMISAERARDPVAARETLAFAIRLLSFVALPAAVFLGVLSAQVTGTAYGGGAYDAADVAMTAGGLAMYAWGVPLLGLTKLLAAASYAWRDTRQPVVAAAVNLAVFYALGLLLTPRFGVAGIAAAASAGQACNAATLLALNGFARRLPSASSVFPGVLRHLLAAAAMAASLLAVRPWLPPMLTTSVRSMLLIGVLGVGSLAVYGLVLVAVGASEWRDLLAIARRRRKGA